MLIVKCNNDYGVQNDKSLCGHCTDERKWGEKRCDLRQQWKMEREGATVTCDGWLFHRRAAATGNAEVVYACWLGDRKGIRPVKTSASKPVGMAVGFSGWGSVQSVQPQLPSTWKDGYEGFSHECHYYTPALRPHIGPVHESLSVCCCCEWVCEVCV